MVPRGTILAGAWRLQILGSDATIITTKHIANSTTLAVHTSILSRRNGTVEHSLTARAHTDPLNAHAQKVLDILDVLAASLRQLFVRLTIRNWTLPARERLVFDIHFGQNIEVSWEAGEFLLAQYVARRDLDFRQVVKHVELGQVQRSVAVNQR